MGRLMQDGQKLRKYDHQVTDHHRRIATDQTWIKVFTLQRYNFPGEGILSRRGLMPGWAYVVYSTRVGINRRLLRQFCIVSGNCQLRRA